MIGSVRSVRYPSRTGMGVTFSTLPGAPMEARHFASSRAVHDVGIERIRRDVTVLDHSDGMPIAESDFAVVAAARNADRSALLLCTANLIWKRVGRNDVIKLRSGLVVPGTPCLAAVHRDQRALIARPEG